MNEVKSINHTGKNTTYQARRMVTKSWQHALLIGACSLVLGASSTLCGLSGASPAVSYATQANAPHAAAQAPDSGAREHFYREQLAPVYQQPQRQARMIQSQSRDVQSMAGFNAGQPSIYHSIIDRTDAPARRASPAMQTTVATTAGDLHTAAGHHHGHAHAKYYEYRAVPKKNTWKFGYKRGNHKHTISRHEHGKAGKHPHFKTKVKWHDKKSKGKGIHLWDYNHHDKKHYHHG